MHRRRQHSCAVRALTWPVQARGRAPAERVRARARRRAMRRNEPCVRHASEKTTQLRRQSRPRCAGWPWKRRKDASSPSASSTRSTAARAERADQLVLQVGIAGKGAGCRGRSAGGHAGAPEAAPHVRSSAIEQPGQPTPRPCGPSACTKRRTCGGPADRHDDDAFGAQVAAAPPRQRLERRLVAPALDQDRRPRLRGAHQATRGVGSSGGRGPGVRGVDARAIRAQPRRQFPMLEPIAEHERNDQSRTTCGGRGQKPTFAEAHPVTDRHRERHRFPFGSSFAGARHSISEHEHAANHIQR